MYLYLMRHGEAKSKAEDPERGLTVRGIENAKKSAAFLEQTAKEITAIWHSGKKRAEQTANILAGSLGAGGPVEKCAGLKPNDDISIIKKQIEKTGKDSIALVGHLPHLSRLVSGLLTGDENREIIRLQCAGIVCLSGENRDWEMEWMVSPGIIK